MRNHWHERCLSVLQDVLRELSVAQSQSRKRLDTKNYEKAIRVRCPFSERGARRAYFNLMRRAIEEKKQIELHNKETVAAG